MEIKLFEIHEPINFAPSVPAFNSVFLLFPPWNSWDADTVDSAGKVDRGQIWAFSWLPLLWAINTGAKQWMEEKRHKSFFFPLSPPQSFHPERNSTHLGISMVEDKKINTCIWLIIKDSLNEDWYFPLTTWYFHETDFNFDFVVAPNHWVMGKYLEDLLYFQL